MQTFRIGFTAFRAALLAVLIAAFPAAASAAAFAPEEGFGIGFVLGTPSGLSASLPLGEGNAINAIAGYALTGEPNLHLQADYVWLFHDLPPVESGKFALYYGPGGFVRIAKDAAVGIHAVVGVDYRFQDVPLQAFLELGPGIRILPDTEPAATAGLGLRYYF